VILTVRNNCADAKSIDFNVLYSDNETLAKHSIFVLIKKKKTKFCLGRFTHALFFANKTTVLQIIHIFDASARAMSLPQGGIAR